MPIIPTDAISGNVYVVAASAEEAKQFTIDHLGGSEVRNVFNGRKDAFDFARDPFRPGVDGRRVYVVSLDIRLEPTE